MIPHPGDCHRNRNIRSEIKFDLMGDAQFVPDFYNMRAGEGLFDYTKNLGKRTHRYTAGGSGMQITRGGVTVQPLTFQVGVVILSGGATGGGTGSGTGSGTGGTTGDTGGGGFLPALGSLLLGLATFGGIAASTPPPAAPPAVTAAVTPSDVAPSAPVAVVAPSTVAATPPVATGGRSTPAPIVLAASAAQTKPAGVSQPSQPKHGPGFVLPYTGANLWLPFAAGSGFLGFGIWLRRFAARLTEE